MLDAASITVSLVRGEYNTAGSVMFLLKIGDIMEEWTRRKSVADLASVMAIGSSHFIFEDEGARILKREQKKFDSLPNEYSHLYMAINSGAAIAREIADVTISDDDLHSLIIMKKLSDGLMKRIQGNYYKIISFNSFLILMGVLGIFPSTTTALLHNVSTIGISLQSMTNLIQE